MFSKRLAILVCVVSTFVVKPFSRDNLMIKSGIFKERREALSQNIKRDLGCQSGAVLLFSGFEVDCRYAFRPENYFYYYTGIKEPGVAVLIDLSGKMTLFLPKCEVDRSLWESSTGRPDDWSEVGVDAVKDFGQSIRGIGLACDFSQESVENLTQELKAINKAGGKVFSVTHSFEGGLPGLCAKWFFSRLSKFVGQDLIASSAAKVADQMRRIKDAKEVAQTSQAIEGCIKAHKTVAKEMRAGMRETKLKNIIQDCFDSQNLSSLAFRSIAATGKNATVLHHGPDRSVLSENDLVVVDIGCEAGFYSSDLTRTYPVSGKFSPRQAELYSIVLAAQKHIEALAKPGVLLRGESGSLHQAAVEFFKQYGLEKYFFHGIGHYMGLDVHDVGSYKEPLSEGCVFTIEPGLYIAEEGIGIRIEDDYLIGPDGLVRLSANLPREIEEVEAMMG